MLPAPTLHTSISTQPHVNQSDQELLSITFWKRTGLQTATPPPPIPQKDTKISFSALKSQTQPFRTNGWLFTKKTCLGSSRGAKKTRSLKTPLPSTCEKDRTVPSRSQYHYGALHTHRTSAITHVRLRHKELNMQSNASLSFRAHLHNSFGLGGAFGYQRMQ